jgi:ubiquinone biosynthesis protein
MNEQVGWRGLLERLKNEAPRYAQLLPELPRLMHQALKHPRQRDESPLLQALLVEQRRTNRLLQALAWVALGFFVGLVFARLMLRGG